MSALCMLHHGSNCSLARAMDGRIMRCSDIRSCQPAATFEIVKLSIPGMRQRVNSAIKYQLDNCNCHRQLPGFTIMDEHMMLYIVNVQN